MLLVVGSESFTWVLDQLALAEDTDRPNWPVIGLFTAGAALVFAVPPLWFPRRWPGLRAAGLAWTAATVLFALLGVLRALPMVHNELYLAVFALVTGGLAAAIRVVRRRRTAAAPAPAPAPAASASASASASGQSVTGDHGTEPVDPPVRRRWPTDAMTLAVAGGLISLLPWLWFGALGGILETVLAVLAAAGFGALVGTVLNGRFWGAYTRLARWRLVIGGGYVAGVAIALLTAGLGGAGVQLPALVALPALGYAAGALQRRPLGYPAGAPRRPPPTAAQHLSITAPQDPTAPQHPSITAAQGRPLASGVPVAVLVGMAAFGPLGFADPEEFSILLGFESGWLLLAAVTALGVGLGFALGAAVTLRHALRRPWLAALFTAVVALAAAGAYATGQPGLHGERLFVVLSSQASLADVHGDRGERIGTVYRRLVAHAERTQRPLRRALDRLGIDYTPYYLVNGISVNAGPLVRQWLAGRGDVDRVLLDPVLRPIPGDPSGLPISGEPGPAAPEWNLEMVGAPRVWSEYGVTGEGVVVGSSDSGVDGGHPALEDNFRGGGDSWYDPWNHTRTPTDFGGHGTHTTGSAVGGRDIGVAPGARWVGCVNLARNMASPSKYLDCLQFMLAPYRPGQDAFTDGDPARAPHVLNNSWGCPDAEGCDATVLAPAVSAFRAAGIFFVASAGNTGPRCGSLTDPPARHRGGFTVAAVTEGGRVASFSSRGRRGAGPQPDIAAPGAGVLSAIPGGGYATLDGTSMAGPHVAGAVALLWSAVPSLRGDIAGTEKLLRDTATPITGTTRCGAAAAAGAGIINAYAAIRAAHSQRP